MPLSNYKENEFITTPYIYKLHQAFYSSNKDKSSCTSTQNLLFQQNIVYITPKSYLGQLTSFLQTAFPPAVGSINLHAAINQINKTIFKRDLEEIRTDQIEVTLVQLCLPKLLKCYGCGTLKLNNLIPETPNDLIFVSNTGDKKEGQIKFSQYPQNTVAPRFSEP